MQNRKTKETLSSKPDGISVVVCTYNGKDKLEATLQSIFQQKTNKELLWEVLVIDNASSDGTKDFCIELRNKLNFTGSFKVLLESNPGLNNARIKGLAESKYNWILFCDDDNHLFDNYVQNGFNIISKNDSIGALGGMGLPIFESEKPEWFDQYYHSYAVGTQNATNGRILSNNPEVYGAGCFFYKLALQKIFATGFQTIMSDRKGKSLSSGGDVEWCYLIHLMRYEIWFSDELKFHHLIPASRITWSYYLKLKSGIASGSALLFPYMFTFKNDKASSTLYLIKFLQKLLTYNFINFLHFSKIIFRKRKITNRSEELGYLILKAKAKSYRKNILMSLIHYKAIKLLQGKLKIML